MLPAARFLVLGYFAQATSAAILALLLTAFYHHYRRGYLRHWAWSWWALAAYHLGAGVALRLVPVMPPEAPARLLSSALTLAAGYLQVVWLIAGARELATGMPIERRRMRWWLAASVVLAMVSTAVTLPTSPEWRIFLRVGLRALAAAAAFGVAGAWILGRRPSRRRIGRAVMGLAFLLYAGQQLHYFVLTAYQAVAARMLGYAAYLALVDLVLQMALGLGMVVWLLEQERTRALAASERLEHLAYHDPTTGLPNRKLLVDRLDSALARARRYGGRVAVCLLDLDRFRGVNESLGHAGGDRLLAEAALRLSAGVRASDTVARLGADELAVLLPDVAGQEAVGQRIDELLAALKQPFGLDGRSLEITASAGISRFPEDAEESQELLNQASLALVWAKEHGRDRWCFHRPDMTARGAERLELERDLRQALERSELEIHYQPILDAVTRRVDAVEALLRWRHPQRGLLRPERFLWVLDGGERSRSVDLWVLRDACRQVARWRHGALRDLRLSVNLAAPLFESPTLAAQIAGVLRETGLPAGALVLEITENLAMAHADQTRAVFAELKGLGVRLALDDFGTGYSSLSYLIDLPLDTLKLDRSFLRTLSPAGDGAQIPAAVVSLAHGLGLTVVAEGVEERHQWHAVRQQGCEWIQGHLFCPALPAGECYQRIRQGRLPSPPEPAPGFGRGMERR